MDKRPEDKASPVDFTRGVFSSTPTDSSAVKATLAAILAYNLRRLSKDR